MSAKPRRPHLRAGLPNAIRCALLFGTLLTGSVLAQSPGEDKVTAVTPNPQVQIAADGLHFSYKGQPFFPVGMYGGAIHQTNAASGHPGTSFNAFLNRLHSLGLNYTRAWIHWGVRQGPAAKADPAEWDYRQIHPYNRDPSAGNAIDGEPKFNLNSINDEWLNLIENAVQEAGRKNIVLQIPLFDCWHVEYQFGTDYYVAQNNTSIAVAGMQEWLTGVKADGSPSPVRAYQAALVNKVLDRLVDEPNVVFETCNETPDGHQGFDQFVSRLITDRSPGHLVLPTHMPVHETVAGHRLPSVGQTNPAALNSFRNQLISQINSYNPKQPHISDNDYDSLDWGWAAGRDFVRRKAWAAFTAGGHMNFFLDGVDRENIAAVPNLDDAMADAQLIARLPALILAASGNQSVVRYDGMTALSGRVADPDNNWAFGRNGQYFVYLVPTAANPRTVTLLQSAANRVARWIDPRNRQVMAAATPEPGSNGNTFRVPSSPGADWVLFVDELMPPPAANHGLRLTYRPAGSPVGSNQQTLFNTPTPAPAVSIDYDETLGNFEQRAGGICHRGYQNPDYVELQYEGQGFESCTFRTSTSQNPVACPAGLVSALLAGQTVVLSTDEYAIDPATCLRKQPLSANVQRGVPAWWELSFQHGGQTHTRRATIVKDTVQVPYRVLVGKYRPAATAGQTMTVSSLAAPPAVGYHYNQSLGNFEQRPGGRCADGSNNSSYVRLSFAGDAFDSCTFRTSFDGSNPPAMPCSAGLRDHLINGGEIIIGTDAYEPVAGNTTCPVQFSGTPRAPIGSTHWIELNFSKAGQPTQTRRLNITRTP